jgi:hypothetical protein
MYIRDEEMAGWKGMGGAGRCIEEIKGGLDRRGGGAGRCIEKIKGKLDESRIGVGRCIEEMKGWLDGREGEE